MQAIQDYHMGLIKLKSLWKMPLRSLHAKRDGKCANYDKNIQQTKIFMIFTSVLGREIKFWKQKSIEIMFKRINK